MGVRSGGAEEISEKLKKGQARGLESVSESEIRRYETEGVMMMLEFRPFLLTGYSFGNQYIYPDTQTSCNS